MFRIRIWSRIHMFLGFLDPDPDPSLICSDWDMALDLAPDPGRSINKQKMKKNYFVTYL
jgi:hypothetical protein